MEDFDIELDSDIGTSVSKIKNKGQKSSNNFKNSETDIDYDKVIEILNESENKNYQSNQLNNEIPKYVQDVRPKREINMNQFVRNIENVLENKNSEFYRSNEPIPSNLTPNMINQMQSNNFTQIPPVDTIQMKQTEIKNVVSSSENSILNSCLKDFKYLDILIYILVFVLLNNKIVINFIQEKILLFKSEYNIHYNLLLRGVIFGLIIFLIKKFKL